MKIIITEQQFNRLTKINNEPIKSVDQLTSKLNSGNTGVLLEVLTESGRKEYIGFGL